MRKEIVNSNKYLPCVKIWLNANTVRLFYIEKKKKKDYKKASDNKCTQIN